MDPSASVSPSFAEFHRLHLHYCDGASFSGDRIAPLTSASGKPLYLRGRRVLEAQVAAALELGLREADEVLFSGGSAGGIGVMHAANWVRAAVPHAHRFKVLVLSGYFLEHRSGGGGSGSRAGEGGPEAAEGGTEAAADTGGDIRAGRQLSRALSRALPRAMLHASASAASSTAAVVDDATPECRRGHAASTNCVPWVAKMRRMCELHNCTAALVAGGCGADLPAAQKWRCLFGRRSAAAVTVPTFFINSAIDAWQMVNVWRRFARCRWDGVAGCTSQQIGADVDETNVMLRAFVTDLRASGALERRGNGAFITSCEAVATLH